MRPLKKGTILLAQYRLETLLGRGGMGEVWSAWDMQLRRMVAIKIMLPALAAEPGYLDRFDRETQNLAKFKHENICRVYAAGLIPDSEPPQLYMAMELVDGKPLSLMLRISKRLDETSACHFVFQLLEALQEAHGEKVIHRDVKPENVIVGKSGHVKLIDFGIAKGRETTGELGGAGKRGPARITHRIGTPRYMSPEQIQGGEIDGRSDVYSAGVVLYLALAGDFPYPGLDDDDETAILMAHLETPPVPLPMIVPDLSPELWAIVLRMLAKDREERYQSSEAAATALSAYIRGSIEPDHPLAKKMAHDRRTIAHKAVYEHSQSRRPPSEAAAAKAAAQEPVVAGREAIPPPPAMLEAAHVEPSRQVITAPLQGVQAPAMQAVEPPPLVTAPPVPPAALHAEPDDPTSPWAHATRAAPSTAGTASASKTAPLPVVALSPKKPPRVSSSGTARSWAKPRPAVAPSRIARDLLRAVALGSAIGALAFGGLRLGRALSRPAAAVASAAAATATLTASAAPTVSAIATAALAVSTTATATAAPAASATATAAPAASATATASATAAPVASATAALAPVPAGPRVARVKPAPPATAAPESTPAPPPPPPPAPPPTSAPHRVFGSEE